MTVTRFIPPIIPLGTPSYTAMGTETLQGNPPIISSPLTPSWIVLWTEVSPRDPPLHSRRRWFPSQEF